MSRAEWFPGRVRDVRHRHAGRRERDRRRAIAGSTASRRDVRTPAGDAHAETPLLGLGNLANVLAATAVAVEFDVPLEDIVERAATLRPATHRGELLRLPGGITLIDDSYNSSPAALRQALAHRRRGPRLRAPKSRCSARCSSSARTRQRLHAECGPRRGRAPASTC